MNDLTHIKVVLLKIKKHGICLVSFLKSSKSIFTEDKYHAT